MVVATINTEFCSNKLNFCTLDLFIFLDGRIKMITPSMEKKGQQHVVI